MNLLEDINFEKLEGFANTPEAKYNKYIKSHCEDVQKAYDYLKEYLYDDIFPLLEIPEEEMDRNIEKHDETKYSKEEFQPYVDHFYGNNGGEQKEESPEYQKAWRHHYNNNPHHPEFWGKGTDMPFSAFLEMMCDWWSFSWKNGNLREIIDFWQKDKPEKIKHMSKNTIERVEWFLDLLENHLKKHSNTSLEEIEEALSMLTESSLIKTKDIIDTKQFDKIQNLIKSADRILIVRHISPDADAIYSAKALWTAIREKFPAKKVILGNEQTRVDLTNKDLLILLDLGVQSRIAAQYTGNPKVVRIDHHETGMKADVCIELPEAGSTSEIITLFLDDQGYKFNKEVSEGLFKGIIADTGRMQYSLSQTTLAAISLLTGFGLDYKKVYNQMYVKDDISLKGKSYILGNYKKTPNGVAYLYLDKQRARQAGIDFEKTGIQVYEMSEIKGCPIWIVIMDRGNGKYNMRLSSRIISIDRIAREFGGGGHSNACGISVNSKEEVKKELMRLDSYLKENRKNIPVLNENKDILDEASSSQRKNARDTISNSENKYSIIASKATLNAHKGGQAAAKLIAKSNDSKIGNDVIERGSSAGITVRISKSKELQDEADRIIKTSKFNKETAKKYSKLSESEFSDDLIALFGDVLDINKNTEE